MTHLYPVLINDNGTLRLLTPQDSAERQRHTARRVGGICAEPVAWEGPVTNESWSVLEKMCRPAKRRTA